MEEAKRLTLEEIKKIELEILDYVDKLCKENGLMYYLAWGTLLGAVRHKGFIPWDDDIDIVMPIKDYEQLITIINKKDSPYFMLTPETDPEYYYAFAKIVDRRTILIEKETLPVSKLGIYIDVFPLFFLPDRMKNKKRIQKECWYLRQVWGHAMVWRRRTNSRGKLYYATCFLCSLYGWRRALEQLYDIAKKQTARTGFVAELLDCTEPYAEIPVKWFEDGVEVTFEGKNYVAPRDWNAYLTACYGDYMVLPPAEKRVSNHNFEAFWR